MESSKQSKLAKHWTTFLTNLGFGKTLEQGQCYARQGHVFGIAVIKNRITAVVQGTHAKPYHVQIRIKTFPSEIWDTIIVALAQHAALATAVIDGGLPVEVEKLFQNAGVSLLPQSPKEFAAECSCSNVANPCKHIAAVFCILAQEFIKDPFVVFMLRGKSQDSLLTDLIEKRACIQQESTELLPAAPLIAENLSPTEWSKILADYWQTSDKLDDVHFEEEILPTTC